MNLDRDDDDEETIDGGCARRVWAVRCGACDTWLPDWGFNEGEAEDILRVHQDELHD